MSTTNDPVVFEERWNSHVNDLYGLWNTLPKEHWPELKENIENLEELVEVAAEQVDGDEENP